MIRVRDNNTKRFKTMHPYRYPMPDRRHCIRIGKPKPEEKLHAIYRVNRGESKASVARDINVPESTLRGWCKSEAKIRFTVDRELFTKIIYENRSGLPAVLDDLTTPQQELDQLWHSGSLNNTLSRPTSTEFNQSTIPTSNVVAMKSPSPNYSQPYRPWCTNVENAPNTSTANLHSPNEIGSDIHHFSPITKEEPMLSQHAKLNKPVVTRLEAVPSVSSAPPTDLSIRLNPMTETVRTVFDQFNNNSTTNNRINDNNNNTAVKDSANEIDPFEALRYAQIFYNWFKTYSDPTVTAQDFTKFEELLLRVVRITQRLSASSCSSQRG